MDIKYAKAMNAAIKIFGTSRKVDGKVYAMVSPMMINQNSPLYSVNDVFNAIFVRGNVLGDVMFYGRGAGKLPTASAVVADVVDAVKHMGKNIMTIWSTKKLELASIDEASHRFFVRLSGEKAANESAVAGLFGDVEEVTAEGVTGEYAFITKEMTEKAFKDASLKLPSMVSRIRVNF